MKKVIFGNTVLFESTCPSCKEQNLTGSNVVECASCLYEYDAKRISSVEIVVSPKGERRPIPRSIKKQLLEKQNSRCFWCDRLFGTPYERKNKISMLFECGDHKIPFAYLKGNPKDNWVLACNVCNSWKSSKLYNTDEELKLFLKSKWDKELSIGKIKF